jgi:hypothetical protein
MKELVIGDRTYRIGAVERNGEWLAHAERADNGDRFGPEHRGATEREALDRAASWLEWQAEHAAALEALQTAERAYHRTIAGSAFVGPVEGPYAVEIQKESLDELEAARTRLDEIRQRKPD